MVGDHGSSGPSHPEHHCLSNLILWMIKFGTMFTMGSGKRNIPPSSSLQQIRRMRGSSKQKRKHLMMQPININLNWRQNTESLGKSIPSVTRRIQKDTIEASTTRLTSVKKIFRIIWNITATLSLTSGCKQLLSRIVEAG